MDYSEFRKQYEEQHPASVPVLNEEVSIYPDWLERIVGAMFVCASLLSGVHTIPAVRGGMNTQFWPALFVDLVSITSFVAIELVFFVAAYALMRRFQWHVGLTLAIAFIVAMVANLQQNIVAYQAGDPGTIIVAVTLGIGAPLIAFMAGKMFVDIHKARRFTGSEANKRYENEKVKWDKIILREFNKNGTSRVFMKSHEANKPRVKLHEIAREIHEKGDANLSTAEMMEKYGISEGSTTNVRKILKSNDYTNGRTVQ